jgi:hypothetical protein
MLHSNNKIVQNLYSKELLWLKVFISYLKNINFMNTYFKSFEFLFYKTKFKPINSNFQLISRPSCKFIVEKCYKIVLK